MLFGCAPLLFAFEPFPLRGRGWFGFVARFGANGRLADQVGQLDARIFAVLQLAAVAFGFNDQLAVIGNPVAHSKSPLIHAAFARQTGEALTYDTLYSELNEFESVVQRFRDAGGHGLNVT